MVRTHGCSFYAHRVRLVLPTTYTECLRGFTREMAMVYRSRVHESVVCRWALRLSAESLRDTVLRVGSSAQEMVLGFLASLPVKGVPSGCWTGSRWQSCGFGSLLILGIRIGTTNGIFP